MVKVDYNKLWQQSLASISHRYVKSKKHQRWFDTWFGDVKLEQYDPSAHILHLQVPSKYVYEYLETHGRKILHEAVKEQFPDAGQISYRILPPAIPYERISEILKQQQGGGWRINGHIHFDNARKRLEEGLQAELGDKPMRWVDGYSDIVKFLDDNDNRGLLIVGTPGLGKSLISQKVIPTLLYDGVHSIPCVSAMDLHRRLDELKRERIVVIDDLGKEPRKYYGDVDNSFLELCTHAEETGQILIITTNLATFPTTYPGFTSSIQERYGDAVMSRLQAITHVAILVGEDLR